MKKYLVVIFAVLSTAVAHAQTKEVSDTTAAGFPVLRSYVAPDVIHRAKKKYGRLLYCIEKTTAANCRGSYLVGLIRNGRLTMEWMCDDPKMVWRVDEPVETSSLTI